jgi:hypothetical protein
LVSYLANRDPNAPLWPGSWWQRSADMLRMDLSSAGIASEDDQGRVVDFHGQRTTFITGLARAGVKPATAQRLARHSDINLTLGTYTRLDMEDLAGAVNHLPELRLVPSAPPTEPEALAAQADDRPNDPDLDRIVTTWPRLAEPIRKAILALLATVEPDPNHQTDPKTCT